LIFSGYQIRVIQIKTMYKIFTIFAITASVNFSLGTSQVLAQLTPQQCNNDLNQILSAHLSGNISQGEFTTIANQHHDEHPECSEYVSGSQITPEQLELQRMRNLQHLEHMRQFGEQQVENYKRNAELMR
jgi:hypothetical protein